MQKYYYSILQSVRRTNAKDEKPLEFDEVGKSYSLRNADKLFNWVKKLNDNYDSLERYDKQTRLVKVNLETGEQEILRLEEYQLRGLKIWKK